MKILGIRLQGCSGIALLLFVFVAIFLSKETISQNIIGTPGILNYSKQAYNAGNQNRDVAQDKNGIIYFANGEGLLVFDGVYWALYSLPNKTSLRSLAIDDDRKIFVGGQGQIGFFAADKDGCLIYHSLNHLLPEKERIFSDVWNTCFYKGAVFFRTKNKVLKYMNGKMTVYDGVYWSFMGKVNGRLLAYDAGVGLVQLNGAIWEKVFSKNELPPGADVRSVVNLSDSILLISTLRNGLYTISKGAPQPYREVGFNSIVPEGIYSLSKLNNGNIAVATRTGGCFIVNPQGHMIQAITKKEGLQSQNVLVVKEDGKGNIWLGLDNGIDVISYRDAVNHIFPESNNQNTGFASALYNNHLYLGTSIGLYSIPVDGYTDYSKIKGPFTLVKNSTGETWGLSQVYGSLLLANSTGAYIVDGVQANQIDNSIGYWCFQPVNAGNKVLMLGGHYNGINLFSYQDGTFQKLPIKTIFESARFIVQYGDVIWVAHPYMGLFKVFLNQSQEISLERYSDKQKIISPNHNKIFMVMGKLVLVNDLGIFEYNEKIQDFVRSAKLTAIFGERLISYLYEDRYGNLWFTSDRKLGIVSKKSDYNDIAYIGELENKFTLNFENINVIDSNNVIIGAEKGFFHINLRSYTAQNAKPFLLIRSVKTLVDGRDSVLYGGYPVAELRVPEIAYNKSGISIRFAATEYRHPQNIEYSYYLEGFEKDWSVWNRRTEKEYGNLPPGSYTFHVRCRNGDQHVSDTVHYSFIILPPWYQTWWAKCIYIFCITGLLWTLFRYQQYQQHKRHVEKLKQQQIKHEEDQRRQAMEHRLEVQENEKKIIELTNEKLNAELEHKNQELASSAMNLVRKIEVMSKLKEDLVGYKAMTDEVKSRKEFSKIIKVIDNEIDNKQEWDRFAVHFDKVHNDYLKTLKEHFPGITANELKLAAYLKLNISSKEIAQLMNISIRGVETARFRLRKKLGISSDTNLADFLMRFPDINNHE